MSGNDKIRATVIVLGDLGRSPRMQYHARSLADLGVEVDLVGYAGSALPESVARHPKIHCHLLPPRPFKGLDRFEAALSSLVSVLRIGVQAIKLFFLLLFGVRRPDLMLLQNPPGIPALGVMLLCARLRSSRAVIDWHNFSYSMLALKFPAGSLPVRLARWYESTLGRRADGHLCVSAAMQRTLQNDWGLSDVALVYDRPARVFALPRDNERAALRRRVAELIGLDPTQSDLDRSALLVSATSWTPDEDFDLLLEAAQYLDRRIAEGDARKEKFPHLYIIISGEGRLRKSYEQRIASMNLRRIFIGTVWFSPEEYPLFLRAADIGLCLHRSSSRLDLPMKVADMLGSGLPVMAFDYGACLAERLRHEDNSLLFTTAFQLADQIFDLFQDYPGSAPLLDRLRRNVAAAAEPDWDAEWIACAPALLNIHGNLSYARSEGCAAGRR